jgi:hypothetical protein
MPEHNPEDRVRVKNLVNDILREDGIDPSYVQTFWITRMRKVSGFDANANPTTREVPEEKEIEWDFSRGFFFFWGGKAYTIRPGETKAYYRWMAEHCVGHMVQYILNRKYQSTKRMDPDGTPRYDNNILSNQVLRKTLVNRLVEGVEEWFGGSEDDFDTMLARQFGGDAESAIVERTDAFDTELPEVSQDEPLAAPRPSEAVPATSDPELAKAREEADANGIAYKATDSATTVKAKIIKEMA